MDFLIFLVVLAAVVVFVTRPLWRPTTEAPRTGAAEAASSQVADLEAAREAKYREIRDAELDHRTGKLSPEDFEAIDRTLRAEALEILRELDRAHGRTPTAGDLPAAASSPGARLARHRPERLPSA